MKNAIKEKSEIESLTEEIAGLQQESAALKVEIQEFEQQLLETAEAIQLSRNSPKYKIQEGEFLLFDEMQKLLEASKDEEERQQKLSALEKALEQGEALLLEKRKKMSSLDKQILLLKNELDWQQNYADFVPQFRHGYKIPQSQIKRQRQIEYNLNLHENYLQELLAASETPQSHYLWEKANPQRDSLPVMIERWQAFVSEGKKELKKSLSVDQTHFREYIKARVSVDDNFRKLLEAQQTYIDALESFKEQARGHQEILGIDLAELTLEGMPVVEVGQGERIEIVKPKKIPVKKQSSRGREIRIIDEYSVSNY